MSWVDHVVWYARIKSMSINVILAAIDQEIQRLQSARTLLTDVPAPAGKKKPGRPKKAVPLPTKPAKRIMSPEARARIAAAQKKRWAATKKAAK
jgi:hypothetical protein